MAEGTLGSAAMLKRGDGVKGVACPSCRVCRGAGGRAGYCTRAGMPGHLHRKLWRCGGERVRKAAGEEEWAEVTGPLLLTDSVKSSYCCTVPLSLFTF
eukprot:COSAG02_NODE_112_length_35994_cov_12.152695_7_plen_98_part_00